MLDPSTRTAARILQLLPRERFTRALGRLTDARVPKSVLKPVLGIYSRAFRVDMTEAVTPPSGFATFNEFFTRRLRDGARPIDRDGDTLISPADGRLDDFGPITRDRTFDVKGQTYDVASLLADREDASSFEGGAFAVIYLSPRDYHRVHSPVDGEVRRVRHVPGTLYPVNAWGVRSVPQLFAKNERVVIDVASLRFGRVAIVMVGAMVVGKIALTFDAPSRPEIGGMRTERTYGGAGAVRLQRGDEVGSFQLGSTVVLLIERGRHDGSVEWDSSRAGSAVRMGEAIARAAR